MNKHFAEIYSGLEFPLVKWEKSVNYDYMRRYLHALHEKQGGGMTGCIGKRHTFSLKNALPCVNIVSFMPPHEDFARVPLFSKHKSAIL